MYDDTATESIRRPGRILALDVGRRRVGLALSDELGITARGLPTLARSSLRADLEILATLCQQQGVTLLLVGEPRHMDGRPSAQGDRVRDFAERLATHTALPVRYWDERLTSVEAKAQLGREGVNAVAARRAGEVDQRAALILLTEFLDSLALREDALPWQP